MAFNSKLFNLGNEVVRLRQRIDKVFPAKESYGHNEFKYLFSSILELINSIRLAIQDDPDGPEQLFLKLKVTAQERREVFEFLEERGILAEGASVEKEY